MKFLSFDIRIGSATRKPLKETRLKFHENVVNAFYPNERIERVGISETSPITYEEHESSPNVIYDIIHSKITAYKQINKRIDLCLVDLTSNDHYLLREQLLDPLYRSCQKSAEENRCDHYLILARNVLGNKSSAELIRKRIPEIKSGDYSITLVFDNGDYEITSSRKHRKNPTFNAKYIAARQEMEGDIDQRLENKCICKLGHFHTRYLDSRIRCRHFSYFMHEDSEKDFKDVFDKWWHNNKRTEKNILFDLKNNMAFRDAIAAFCESIRDPENKVKAFRLESILQPENKRYLDEVRKGGDCLLILDVIETGKTLKEYVNLLKDQHINISKDVVVAINKTGSLESKLSEYNIHGFVKQKQSQSVEGKCVQCELGLPEDSDDSESFLRIRTFDMLYMADKAGYDKETDVPPRGVAYRAIPRFHVILETFGDWIAYKLLLLLHSQMLPDQYFIIYPDQIQSRAMVDKMKRLGPSGYKFDVIPVNDKLLKEASKHNDDWAAVFDMHLVDPLRMQLESIKGKKQAIILDIFWGSGGTYRRLEKLLELFGMTPYAYICLVDFMPNSPTEANKLSLYQWFNPRKTCKVN